MVTSRPALGKVTTATVGNHVQTAARAIERRLPGSAVHSERTRSALYAAGSVQALVAVIYAYLAMTADESLYLRFLPSTDYLFWIPFCVALGGIALTGIALVGSISAGWLVALVQLPLAMTALYVDNVLGSFALVAALIGTAIWLGRSLVADAQHRPEPDPEQP